MFSHFQSYSFGHLESVWWIFLLKSCAWIHTQKNLNFPETILQTWKVESITLTNRQVNLEQSATQQIKIPQVQIPKATVLDTLVSLASSPNVQRTLNLQIWTKSRTRQSSQKLGTVIQNPSSTRKPVTASIDLKCMQTRHPAMITQISCQTREPIGFQTKVQTSSVWRRWGNS